MKKYGRFFLYIGLRTLKNLLHWTDTFLSSFQTFKDSKMAFFWFLQVAHVSQVNLPIFCNSITATVAQNILIFLSNAHQLTHQSLLSFYSPFPTWKILFTSRSRTVSDNYSPFSAEKGGFISGFWEKTLENQVNFASNCYLVLKLFSFQLEIDYHLRKSVRNRVPGSFWLLLKSWNIVRT